MQLYHPAPLSFEGATHALPAIRHYRSESEALRAEKCNDSVHFFYPEALAKAAKEFVYGFKGKSLYAVKANPADHVLKAAWASGIRAFDVASLREIEAVHSLLPKAELYFMHPVKSREAIRRAYSMGVRRFSFDSMEELFKIYQETDKASDLTLFLRVAVNTKGAAYSLGGKFGATPAEAVDLLRAAKALALKLGVCFHVGSQCMRPDAYRRAIQQVAKLVEKARVSIDILDVGGGFPVAYPGMPAKPLMRYFDTIHNAVHTNGFGDCDLIAEPGRALVANAGAVAARVELRKDNRLYLNDGTYGALFDAGVPAWPFAVKLIRLTKQPVSDSLINFSAYGPTCDSLDRMAGPFALPADIREGDWVLFETLGSYGQSLQSRFNGFYSETCVTIDPTHSASLVTFKTKN